MTTLRLWTLLRRRSAGRSDPQHLAGALAVLAFAVTTAVVLVVLGGWHAFNDRVASELPEADSYPVLAVIAGVLLLVPLSTLGAAAARLAVARRDERLAALRLAGATTRQVSGLTLAESCTQALVGAAIGVGGYVALIPLVRLVVFQGLPFTYAELLVPLWQVPIVVAAVVAIAAVSAGTSLRRIAITPLGVAARVHPPALHWSRVVPLFAIAGGFAFLFSTGQAGVVVLAVLVGGGLGVLNLLGPLAIAVVARVWVRRADSPADLIAARRLLDNPKGAWRSVGGVGLATFIAGLCAALAMLTGDGDQFVLDLTTGGLLTLAIAAVLAAVSTGVMQAGRVIDQRLEYRALALTGMEVTVMNRARMRETQVPLVAAVAVATGAACLFLVPALSTAVLRSVPVLAQFAVSVAGAILLVLAGAAASGRVLRTVLAD